MPKSRQRYCPPLSFYFTHSVSTSSLKSYSEYMGSGIVQLMRRRTSSKVRRAHTAFLYRPILLFSHWYIRQENRKQKYEDNHKRERRHVFHIYVYLHCICICKLSYGRAQRAAPGPGQARRLSSFGAEDLAARAANHRDFRRRVDDSETSQHDAVVSALSDVHGCAAVDPICRYIHVSTRV